MKHDSNYPVKATDNTAWWLVLPATMLLLVVGFIPLMTVVNYSFHDIFTLPSKHWVGAEWYREIIQSERFRNSLGRSLLYSAVVLAIEIPLGVCIARWPCHDGALWYLFALLYWRFPCWCHGTSFQ